MNRRTFIQATGISLLSPTLFAGEKYEIVKDSKETYTTKRWMKFTEHMPKEGQQILIYHYNEYVKREGFHAGTVIKTGNKGNKDDMTVYMKLDLACGFWEEDHDGKPWSCGTYYSDEGKFALESRIWLQPEDIQNLKFHQEEMKQQDIIFDKEWSVWIPITQQYLDWIPTIPRKESIITFSGK
jgi:hypothetical protein